MLLDTGVDVTLRFAPTYQLGYIIIAALTGTTAVVLRV